MSAHKSNPIIEASMDTFDEPWGWAGAWGFAVAGVLWELTGGDEVPDHWEYRPGLGGSPIDLESWEDTTVLNVIGMWDDVSSEIIGLGDEQDEPEIWAERIAILRNAGEIIHRYAQLIPESARY